MRTDAAGDLHCSDGPAVTWRDGHPEYSWHGVWVDERVIMEPRSFSREEYLAISDTEQRRALGEAAGWDHIVELLGATRVDTWADQRTGLEYALFASGGDKWLRKQSPVLLTGAAPVYFEPVHEELMTARAARKWQATTLTPAACEADPELSYGCES